MEQGTNKPLTVSRPVEPANPAVTAFWWRKLWAFSRIHLIIIGLFTVLAVLFTWPLVLHLTEQSTKYYPNVIDEVAHDRDQNLWNMWWLKKALFDLHVNPFYTSYLFYPYGAPLYLHTLNPFDSLLALPFQSWLGWLGAYNLVNLITVVWCGHSAFLLANYLVKEVRAAFVAAFFFTFSAQHLFNLYGHQLNIITMQFLVLFLLYLIKLDLEENITRRRWWLYTGLGAIWLVLCSLSDQYLLIYSLLITAFYYLARLLVERNWRKFLGLLGRTLPALILAGLILSPFLWQTWLAINSGQFGKIDNEAVPSDIPALLLPPVWNPWVGASESDFGKSFFIQPDARGTAMGLVLLIIGLVGLIREKGARWWGLLMLIALVLAMGAYPSFKNQALDFPLPGRFLNQLPVFEVMRYSKRWLGPASLGAAICAAYLLAGTLRRVRGKRLEFQRWSWALGLLLIFTLEIWPWPVPLTGEEDKLPAAYANNVLPKTDVRPLMELPIRPKYNIKWAEMYWQTAHERPIMWGYLSRIYNLNYNDTPLSFFVDGYNPAASDFLPAPRPEQLRGVLNYYNFAYITVYKKQLDPKEVESWRKLLAEVSGGPTNAFYEDDFQFIYRLPDFKSDPAIQESVIERGSGWSALEKRADGLAYRWILDADGGTLPFFGPPGVTRPDYKLRFEAAAYYRERNVEVRLNGQLITQLEVGLQLARYEVSLNGSQIKEGDNLITLRPIEPPDKPSDHEKTVDTRSLTILVGGIKWDKA